MSKNNKLLILLDTPSLKSPEAKRLMSYDDNDLFEFVSLGAGLNHPHLEIKRGPTGLIEQLIIDKSNRKTEPYQSYHGFAYLDRDMKGLSGFLNIKLDDLMNIFLLSTLITNDRKTILVTERKKLINRSWWDRSFSSVPKYSVLSPREASIFIDLHCKKHGEYMSAPHYFLGEWLWYWFSMKSKVVKYQLPWSTVVFAKEKEIANKRELMDMISALADRLVDMLTAIDEIGQQYYLGVNNNTQSKIVYHFNYWLALYVGVLDNLALITLLRYQIPIVNVEKVGFSRSKHKDFLKEVDKHNPQIDSLLIANSNIVNLTHDPRNTVIHRERLKSVTVDNRNEGFYLNMVRISEEFFNRIVALSKNQGDKLNTWGHQKSHTDYFLEPYRFVKETTGMLISFVNEYLDILDFEKYLKIHPEIKKRIKESETKKSHKDYEQSLSIFEKGNLGY